MGECTILHFLGGYKHYSLKSCVESKYGLLLFLLFFSK